MSVVMTLDSPAHFTLPAVRSRNVNYFDHRLVVLTFNMAFHLCDSLFYVVHIYINGKTDEHVHLFGFGRRAQRMRGWSSSSRSGHLVVSHLLETNIVATSAG